jgi:hypothetical protein
VNGLETFICDDILGDGALRQSRSGLYKGQLA